MPIQSPPSATPVRPRSVRAVRAVLSPLYRTLLALEVEGKERVPASDPCILVFNHLSNLDPHLIFTLLSRADATGLVAASYRERAVTRFLVEAGGGMWIRRDITDRIAIRTALRLLADGWLVGIAPEGGRSPDGVLRRAKSGAAYLAIRSGAPLLPVGIDGTDGVVAALVRGRRARVRVKFGYPFRPSPGSGLRGQDLRHTVTHEIMTRLAALLPKERRGPYARIAAGGVS
jgi:1-acyl-sn-glycerol-3-phosphate acyltransferase